MQEKRTKFIMKLRVDTETPGTSNPQPTGFGCQYRLELNYVRTHLQLNLKYVHTYINTYSQRLEPEHTYSQSLEPEHTYTNVRR